MLQFTTEYCSCCSPSKPRVICDSTNIQYLDSSISFYKVGNVWQLKSTPYSKPTDVHGYISPKSETAPHLNDKSPAIIKGVAHRLRRICTLDDDLLVELGRFGGYLQARGYDEIAIKTCRVSCPIVYMKMRFTGYICTTSYLNTLIVQILVF